MKGIEPILESIEVDREETNAVARILGLLLGTNDQDDHIYQILDDVAYHAAVRTERYLKGE